MKKVYCENCKYSGIFKKKKKLYFYCKLGNVFEDASNLDNNCKFYKRKWWKFWVKEDKRKILKGAQPKTDPGPKPDTIPINSTSIKEYLDGTIRRWRKNLKFFKNEEDKLMAKHYIDAFQSVRVSLLGETLAENNEYR
ncbi:unnamed protein product [marine sediment metagenome]|uniref:Uncharacterized protein n=1 Tax=marine sediment metagenome TaxID=412755 RepID=X1TAF4_9ZZZZ